MNLRREFLMANLERPVAGPVYADAYIERWAGVYLANPALRLLGVPFCAFLAQPEAWLHWASNPLRRDISPFLSSIRQAEAEIERILRAGARCENGRIVEKLKHHAHPRKSHRDFVPEVER